jgi:hypothetical protein
MRSYTALALLVAVSFSGAWSRRPAPAASQGEPTIALNVQPPEPHQVGTVLGLLRAARVRHIRVSWWAWSTRASWAWLPAYRAAGIEVLPLVYPTGNGAENAGRTMAARYRTLFDAYGSFPYVQLGNEVDGAGPFAIRGADPYRQGRRWAAQLREAARLIHQFDPEVRIVAGGMAWVHPGTEEFVRGLVDGGGFDVFAIHIYGIGCAGEPLSRIGEIRAQGWRGPVWATELGVDDGQARYIKRNRDTFQAEQMRTCLAVDPSRVAYERLYWFQLTPDPNGFGILRPDFSPRPAFDWLRSRGGG